MKFIGSKLADLRREKELSLQDLSEITGVNATTLHEIETNKKNPRPATVQKLCQGLRIKEQYFYMEDSRLPTELIPNMPESVKRFFLDADNVPFLILTAQAKQKGVTLEQFEYFLKALGK